MIVGSGELTVVYDDDIRRVVLAYEIIHNGDLPDVLVVDIINHIERAFTLDGDASVVLVPIKNRTSEAKSIVIGGYGD